MKLQDWFAALGERERRTVLAGGAAAALLLVGGGLLYLESATSSVEAQLEARRADLAWMQAVAPRLQSMPAARSDEPLPLLVDRTARESGLASALAGSDPAGEGGLRVRLQDASFDMLVVWLARLQQERGLIIESASIEGTEAEGLVNASLVLRGS